jgi:predicted methyltransferase
VNRKIAPILAALMLTASAGAVVAAAAVPAYISTAVADANRPVADKARDADRKPAETVAFAGVKQGMVVAEFSPGGGYYTRILSKAVGPKGKVYAMVNKAQADRPGGLDAINAMAQQLGNVVVTVQDNTALNLPEKIDLFWTTENFHDYHNGPTANIPALLKGVHDNLKPGGIFYVEDHNAEPGDKEAPQKVHRIDVNQAKQELAAGGFKVDAESMILRNPNDNRKAQNAEASVRGHTDRFMLRLKRS